MSVVVFLSDCLNLFSSLVSAGGSKEAGLERLN